MTHDEALEHEKLFKSAQKGNKIVPPGTSSTKFADLWPHYLDYISTHRKPTTFVDVEISGRHLEDTFKDVDVLNIAEGYISLYEHRRIKEGVSNRTINKELSWFSGFLTWCMTFAHLEVKRPVIEKLEYKRPLPIVLSSEEVKRIFAECDDRLHAFFALLFMCGLRLREVSNLKWQHIDFEKKMILVYGKGGKYRFVPAPEYCLSLLEKYPRTGEQIFTASTGNPLYHVRMQLKKIAKKAGIEKNVYPHVLRHSYATYLVEQGVNLEIIKNLLGHADLAMTTFYTHVAIEHLRNSSDIMENSMLSLPSPLDSQ
jgi:integrase/recombinase XerD